MKKIFFVFLGSLMPLFLNAQNYQEQILGNWQESRMTISFICDGKTYSNIVEKKYEDKIAVEYTFYRNHSLTVNVGYEINGTYRLTGNRLVLNYEAWGHSYDEFPETIKSINSTTMVTESRMSDFVDKEDLNYFIETDGFKQEYASLVRSFAGKEITLISTKYYIKK